MRLIAIDGPWLCWDILGHEYHWKVLNVDENFRNFIVGQMLEHLANQAQIRSRQWVACDIGEPEADARKVYRLDVMFNQLRDHVDADILYSRCLDDLSPDDEVTAS